VGSAALVEIRSLGVFLVYLHISRAVAHLGLIPAGSYMSLWCC